MLKCGRRVQEFGAGFRRVVPLVQIVFQIQFGEVTHRVVNNGPLGGSIDRALVVINEAQGGSLAAAGRQRRALNMGVNVAPQRGRDLESDQHVQRLAGDLRVHCVHVEQLRRLDGALQRRLCDFVEQNALGSGDRQTKHAAHVIRDAGAFAVVVCHEVRFFALADKRLYFFNLGRLGVHDVEPGNRLKCGVNVLQTCELS